MFISTCTTWKIIQWGLWIRCILKIFYMEQLNTFQQLRGHCSQHANSLFLFAFLSENIRNVLDSCFLMKSKPKYVLVFNLLITCSNLIQLFHCCFIFDNNTWRMGVSRTYSLFSSERVTGWRWKSLSNWKQITLHYKVTVSQWQIFCCCFYSSYSFAACK